MDMYDRINGLLAEKRITKRKMCIDLNLPYTTIASMFQRRSTSVDIQLIKKIADYLVTTLEYLLDGNEKYKKMHNENYFDSNTIIVIKNKKEKSYYKLSENDFNALVAIIEKFKSE